MKQKLITAGLVLALIGTATYLLLPVPLIQDRDRANIYRIELANDCCQYKEITNMVDCDSVVQILSNYSRSKFPHSFSPHQITVGELELSIMDSNGTYHILLSRQKKQLNVLYTSAEKGGFKIHDSKNLFQELSALLPSDTKPDTQGNNRELNAYFYRTDM